MWLPDLVLEERGGGRWIDRSRKSNRKIIKMDSKDKSTRSIVTLPYGRGS